MASSSFTSPPFLSTPLSRTHQLSPCSKTPPPQPPTTPPSQTPQLSSSSLEKPITPKVLETNNNTSIKNDNVKGSTTADSTDWIASSLTRRFGLGAGLAWVGFLAVGVISEQVKTRFEVSQEQANTRDLEKEEEVILPNGIRYYNMRIGGGATPRTGDLVVIDLKGSVKDSGEVFVDTFGKNNRSLALVMGSRPYTRGMCEGIEYVLKTMKGGGKRRVIVPPKLGYCDNGADFGSDVSIPPCAALEYIVEVDRVSIAPA
ncbi:peptidyl-prolyl cis-trans isomerase FKBP17-2, chloroplastic-like [Chenopodium quinoa]|uniref:peptidyl-prolyl cis-trans isomerase FKBP17-2, chloroplastic-like n=1 Tax=Chenopodium quinoa TaxID=63459 RepID=UPI000B7837F9|nr:peptidyl-prolyl cis-trans isomerase FKBP17-2, chloroplastic-like [Chenopodium quinoa]